jgi:hypothetical protein
VLSPRSPSPSATGTLPRRAGSRHGGGPALGLRLALALAAGAPVALLAAPGLVYGHSVPRFALIVVRSLGAPRLAVWRHVVPCDPIAPAARPARRRADGWGADREDW